MKIQEFKGNLNLNWIDGIIILLVALPLTLLLQSVRSAFPNISIPNTVSALITLPLILLALGAKRKYFREPTTYTTKKGTLIGVFSALTTVIGLISGSLAIAYGAFSEPKLVVPNREIIKRGVQELVENQAQVDTILSARPIDTSGMTESEK